MLYLFETKLPENKSIFFALTFIYGIGKKTSFIICKKLGFSINLKVKNLSKDQSIGIVKMIESSQLVLSNELKKLRSLSFKRLISIKSYRGIRKVRGFPVRGQRTHTNAKSARRINKYKY